MVFYTSFEVMLLKMITFLHYLHVCDSMAIPLDFIFIPIDSSSLEMRNLIAHPEATTTKRKWPPEAIRIKLSSKLEPCYHIPDLTGEGSIPHAMQ